MLYTVFMCKLVFSLWVFGRNLTWYDRTGVYLQRGVLCNHQTDYYAAHQPQIWFRFSFLDQWYWEYNRQWDHKDTIIWNTLFRDVINMQPMQLSQHDRSPIGGYLKMAWICKRPTKQEEFSTTLQFVYAYINENKSTHLPWEMHLQL